MKQLSIKEIANKMKLNQLDEASIDTLRRDERAGIQRLLRQYDKQIAANEQLEADYLQLVAFENTYRTHANTLIAGVDEAGRGPLAGPVVAASVILPNDFKLLGLTDSKQVTEENRNRFYEEIIKQAISYHISIIDNQIIDKINILEATKRAMTESLLGLDPTPTIALVDAVQLRNTPFPTEAIIKGDAKSLAIAAASILAKVTRDNIMNEVDKEFPQYGFKKHKGYGTKAHLEALERHGASKYHRLTFAPVRAVISNFRGSKVIISSAGYERIQSKNPQANFLRNGQIVQGSILKIYPQNKAEIQIGNQRMVAQVTTPLTIGEKYFFKVEHTDNIVQLRVIGDPLKQDSSVNISQLMDRLGIKMTKGGMELVQTLMNERIPFDAAQLSRAMELFDSAPNKQAAISAIKEMLMNKLPMTNNVFQALVTRDGNTMNQLVANLITELKQVQNPSGSQQKLLHLLENLLSRPAEGQTAIINQIMTHVNSSNDLLVNMLKFAGAIDINASGNSLATNEQIAGLLKNQPALLEILTGLASKESTLPSAARTIMSIFHPIHSGSLSNQQFTAMQSMIQAQIMPHLPSEMGQVLTALLMENTADSQAKVLSFLQTLQSSETYQLSQNIVTNIANGLKFLASPLQEQFMNHLQGNIHTTGILDESNLKMNVSQAQTVFQHTMEMLVTNQQAIQAEAREILQVLNNLLEQNQTPNQTQLDQIKAQIEARILPFLSTQHGQAIGQASQANALQMQQLLQALASPLAFEQLGQLANQNNQLLLSQVTPEMRELLQTMQLPLEQMQLNSGQNQAAETVKSLLLQMIQQGETLPGDRGQQLVHFINGMQMQSVQETGNLLHAQIQIPGEKLGLNKDLFMQFEGRKNENGEIDADYCRILFILHLKNLDETVIDMNIQKRTVSVTIFNNIPEVSQLMTAGLRKSLADGLQKLNYHLTNIKWKQLHETEQPAVQENRVFHEQETGQERYDFRI